VVGAYTLQTSSVLQGDSTIVARDFWPAFVVVTLLAATSIFFHARLPRAAGTEASGHRGD
jgi:hypothetical protein